MTFKQQDIGVKGEVACVAWVNGRRIFNNFIEVCKLMELDLTGMNFTWFG